MRELTLRECLQEPRGYEGRLFQTRCDSLGILVPESENSNASFINPYYILAVNRDKMNVKGYVFGGRVINIDNISLNERFDDLVMSSEDLMEWYRMAGNAGIAGLF